jgi:hypothetical protein
MTMNATYRPLKTIRSHSGLARFLATVSEEPVAEVPRFAEIPSPYAYSPTHVVYAQGEKKVFVVEVAHKTYRVFELVA